MNERSAKLPARLGNETPLATGLDRSAARLGIAKRTLIGLCDQHGVEIINLGRRRLIRTVDLEKILAALVAKQKAAKAA